MATFTEFKNELADQLQKLTRLDVLTVITPNQSPDLTKAASGPYLLTVIDLLQGGIRVEVTDSLLEDKYAPIRAAHAEREKQALGIVNEHIQLIEKVIQKIGDLLKP